MNTQIRNIDFSPEFRFETSKSSGKGGQHVNKVETRVTLVFNVLESELLTEINKELIFKNTSLSSIKPELRISCQKRRSQLKNKNIAVKKFYAWLDKALFIPKKRVPTKMSKSRKKKNAEKKQKHSDKKKSRSWKL